MSNLVAYESIKSESDKAACYVIDGVDVWVPKQGRLDIESKKLITHPYLARNIATAKIRAVRRADPSTADLGDCVRFTEKAMAFNVTIVLTEGDEELARTDTYVWVPDSRDISAGVPLWLIKENVERSNPDILHMEFTVRNADDQPLYVNGEDAVTVVTQDRGLDTEAVAATA